MKRCPQFLDGIKTPGEAKFEISPRTSGKPITLYNVDEFLCFPHLTELSIWHVEVRPRWYSELKQFKFMQRFQLVPTTNAYVKNVSKIKFGLAHSHTVRCDLYSVLISWKYLEYFEFATE